MHQAQHNRPSHRAYLVTGQGDARQWKSLGPVWRNPDDDSFTLRADRLPPPGKPITVRSVTYLDNAEHPVMEVQS